MHALLKVRIPVEAGNRAVRAGTLGKTIQAILADQRPEAVYFTLECGQRTALIFLRIKDSSEIPRLGEPWFLAFNADIECRPVMSPEELTKGLPGLEEAVKKYA